MCCLWMVCVQGHCYVKNCFISKFVIPQMRWSTRRRNTKPSARSSTLPSRSCLDTRQLTPLLLDDISIATTQKLLLPKTNCRISGCWLNLIFTPCLFSSVSFTFSILITSYLDNFLWLHTLLIMSSICTAVTELYCQNNANFFLSSVSSCL